MWRGELFPSLFSWSWPSCQRSFTLLSVLLTVRGNCRKRCNAFHKLYHLHALVHLQSPGSKAGHSCSWACFPKEKTKKTPDTNTFYRLLWGQKKKKSESRTLQACSNYKRDVRRMKKRDFRTGEHDLGRGGEVHLNEKTSFSEVHEFHSQLYLLLVWAGMG